MTQVIHFTNCYLANNRKLTKQDLFVDVISGIIIEKPTNYLDLEVDIIDLNESIISPGFIDVQINGCFGLDYSTTFNDENSKSEFVKKYNHSMEQLLNFGVTSICPTVTSSFPDVYRDVLLILGLKTRCLTKTDSLGVHIEGPFISPLKKGCHPPETLTDYKNGYNSLIERYGEDFEKYTAILTSAPEINGCLELINKIITKNEIVFSIGHTMADYETGLKAVEQGASMITHLYNAMLPITARNPGIPGLINIPKNSYGNDKIPYYGLVADGIHVHPSLIKDSYFANPDKAILVTDAMHLIGLNDGDYKRGNQEISKTGHLLYLKGTKTIAGSSTHLLDCIKNLIKWTGISIEDALATITNNPANSLKISKRKGFLNVGCDADLCILNKNGELINVYKLGQKVA